MEKRKGRKRSGCDLRVADTGIFSLWFFVLYCWRGSSASNQKPWPWCGCDPVFGCVAAFLQGERDVKILAVLSLLLMLLKRGEGLKELLHKKQKAGIDE
ncbi:MAG: hypothetical protein V8S12_08650 [Lachnospiraceae bacterium]